MTQSDETHGDWAGPLPDRCRGLVSRSKRDRDIESPPLTARPYEEEC